MSAETPGSPPNGTPETPPAVQSPNELRRLVKECRVYLFERDTKQAGESSGQLSDRESPQSASAVRLPRMLWQSVNVAGGAIIGLFLAIASQIASGLPSSSTISRVFRSRLLWGITACCTIAVVGVVVHSALTRQRRQAASIDQLAAQLRTLRAQSADEATWEEFTTRSQERLAEIIPALERAATAGDRASIDLLWAARDYLPQMLTDARNAPSEAEHQFDVCMRRVRSHLEIEITRP